MKVIASENVKEMKDAVKIQAGKVFADKNCFNKLCEGEVDDDLKKILSVNKFFVPDDEIDSVVEEYRKINAGLFAGTTLHIFVLTLECNLECLYCQAEYEGCEKTFMTEKTAELAVKIALQSPAEVLNFEFQGGEPLLNFKTLSHIVEYVKKVCGEKKINFSLITNAMAMNEKILQYLAENKIKISFSMDGPKFVHDKNRPAKNGTSNFDCVNHWFHRAKKLYTENGLSNSISAISTITRNSLTHAKEIVDFYCNLGVKYISVRELSPSGRVEKNKNQIAYTAEEFLKFYRECMDYIIQLNLEGKSKIYESFSKIVLQKIFGKYLVNYPDLRSPCGALTGQAAYNWDGKIYTCDEGRMMANLGIKNFCVGDVYKNSYKDCLLSKNAAEICNASCLETNPSCESCVYNPICGICPVYSFFTQNDYVGVPQKQERCKILRGIFNYLLDWLYCEDSAKKNLCQSWGTEP